MAVINIYYVAIISVISKISVKKCCVSMCANFFYSEIGELVKAVPSVSTVAHIPTKRDSVCFSVI